MSSPKQQGYIAVIAAITTTAILIIIALVFSSGNFMGRFDTFWLETKDVARKTAEGCLEYARLYLSLTSGGYPGNETINVGNSTCTILAIETDGNGNKIIKARSTFNNRTVNLRLIAAGISLETISLEEVASF